MTEGARDGKRFGVIFDRARPTTQLPGFSRDLDALGVDDLWLVEDLTWAGSIATTATALAVSERLRVGIGVAPAPFRNPALLAMEFAALSELHPGRLVAGIGHGVPSWMARVGARVSSPLTLLEETVVAVRGLLAGQTVSVTGRYVRLDEIALVHPPSVVPPVITGVVKPKSLRLSGRVADGTVLAEGFGPEDIAAARAHIDAGRAERGTDAPHELLAFVHLIVEPDAADQSALAGPIRREVAGFLGAAPESVTVAEGTPEQAAAIIESLWTAGADTVIVRPVGPDPLATVHRALGALGRS